MRAAYDQYSSYRPQASVRSRALAVGMALGVTILIVLALIQVGALGPHVKEVVPRLITIPLQPPPPARAKSENRLDHSRRAAITPPRPAKLPRLNMVILTPKDYAASDIATLPSHRTSGEQTADAGAASSNSNGPDGQPMYDVDWYREPTHAELAPYMPSNLSESGSAEIACRMIEKFHVEDCRELGESPPGSGLSRALRLASWQFRVRPPRIGGRSILGGWVRIHFDFTASAKAEN
jgi:protein TonB